MKLATRSARLRNEVYRLICQDQHTCRRELGLWSKGSIHPGISAGRKGKLFVRDVQRRGALS
jgi:hypothetical protein